MADLASLKIAVDSRDVKKAQDDLRALGYTATQTEGAATRMTGAFGALKTALAGIGLGFIAREFVMMADSMRLLEARIAAVTPAAENLVAVQQQLVGIAKQNQTAVEGTINLYAKLSRPLRALGGDTQTAVNVTRAFGQALRIGGANTQEATAAMQQFSQAMASGVLRGDEFNSIAEASPRILQAVAQGAGLAEGSLRKLAAEGKLTAGVVGGALLRQMVALEAESMKLPVTVSGAFTNFKTDLALVASDLDKNVGLTSSLVSAFDVLAGVVRVLGTAAANGIGAFTQFVRENKEAVLTATYAVSALGGAMLGLAVASRISAAITGLTATITAMTAASAAARIGFVAMASTMGVLPAIFVAIRTAATALMASLGPLGIALAAVGAGMAYIASKRLAASDALSGAANSTADFTKELDGLNARLAAMRSGDQVKIKGIEQADQLTEYMQALRQRGFNEEQINTLVGKRTELQKLEVEQAARIEATGNKQAAAAQAAAAAEAARKRAQNEAEAAAKRAAEMRQAILDQIADSEEQIKLVLTDQLTIEQARLTTQLRRQGATDDEIKKILALNEQLSLLSQKLELPDWLTEDNPLVAQTDGAKQFADEMERAARAADAFLNTTLNIDLDGVFGNTGKALAAMVNSFDLIIKRQDEYAKAVTANKDNPIKMMELQNKQLQVQFNNYGNVASAAKSFFKEGSAGYKVLQAAETAYRAVSIALALKEMAIKVAGYGASASAATAGAAVEVAAATSVGAANAAAAIANQGKGDPFTAWARIAAMAALMAGLGFAVLGGGKSTAPTTNTGAGTVLGDIEELSKSITKSIDRLVEVGGNTMRYSAQMLNSLKNIEAAMVGVTGLILRTTGITDLASGVATGTSANIGQRVGGTAAMAGAGAGLGFAVGGPVGAIVGAGIGAAMSLIKGLVSSLFGTTTTVVGQGITATAQSVADILATGFDVLYYTDIEKKRKFFGITTSRSYQTQTAAADDEINRQFSLVIQNIYDTVLATAGPLKLASDQVAKNMENFVLNIGKIDVKGLTGEEIQERLTAVFGAAADNIAKAAIPGLEMFQKVGEGYFETIIRVASNIEVLDRTFQMLGRTTQGLTLQSQMALIETFGDATSMMEQVNEYFSLFYSEAEQVAAMSKQLGDALGIMGLTMPDTLAGFRSLVEAQDLNTEAGRRTYAQLIQLSPAFADFIERQKELAEETATTGSVVKELATTLAVANDNGYDYSDLTKLTNEQIQQQIALMRAQGNVAAALALSREAELRTMDAALVPMQKLIWATEDAKAAQDELSKALTEGTRAATELARARRALEIRLLEAQGKAEEVLAAKRAEELASTDALLQPLLRLIFAQEDLNTANEKVAASAQVAAEAMNKAQSDLMSAYGQLNDNVAKAEAKLAEAQRQQRQRQIEGLRSQIDVLDQTIGNVKVAQDGLRKAYDAQISRIDAEISKREENIKNLKASYDAQADVFERTIDNFRNLADSLRKFSATIVPLNNNGPASLAQLRQRFTEALSFAVGGGEGGFDRVSTTGNLLRDAIMQNATNRIDMLRDLYALQRQTDEAAVLAEQNASIAQQQLDTLRAQYDAMIAAEQNAIANYEAQKTALTAQVEQFITLNEKVLSVDEAIKQLETAEQAAIEAEKQKAVLQSQIDALMAVDNSIISVEEAQRELAMAQAERDKLLQEIIKAGFEKLVGVTQKSALDAGMAALAEMKRLQAQQTTTQTVTTQPTLLPNQVSSLGPNAGFAQIEAAVLKANSAAEARAINPGTVYFDIDAQTAAKMGDMSKVGTVMSLQELQRALYNSDGTPKYANGGLHSGGLRIVGENGPEIEATGPSRIYNANQLGNMMGGGATAEEVKALRDELKLAMYQIAKNTGKSYDLLNRWDGDGLPPERIVA